MDLTVPLWKLVQRPVLPIRDTWQDSLPLVLLFALLSVSAWGALRLRGRVQAVTRRAVQLTSMLVFVVYRVVEDYLLVPRIIGRAVEIPALVTVIALLLGGVLLGLIGALVAIPVAAAVLLIIREVLIPRLDRA